MVICMDSICYHVWLGNVFWCKTTNANIWCDSTGVLQNKRWSKRSLVWVEVFEIYILYNLWKHNLYLWFFLTLSTSLEKSPLGFFLNNRIPSFKSAVTKMIYSFRTSFVAPGLFTSIEMKDMSTRISKQHARLTWLRRFSCWNDVIKKPSCIISEPKSDPIVTARPFFSDKNETIINGYICDIPCGESVNLKLPSNR